MEESSAPASRPTRPAIPPRLELAAGFSWRILVVLALAAVVIFALWHIRVVTVPLFFAMVFATLLLPLTDKLTALGLPRGLAVLISIVIFLGLLALAATLIVGSIVGQAGQIGRLISSGAAEVSSWSHPGNGPLGSDRSAVDSVISKLGPGLKTAGSGLLSKASREVPVIVSVFAGALISLAFLIYLLAGAAGLRDWVVQQAAPSRRVAVGRSITAGWTTLSGYVRGTLLISIFVSFFIGVGAIALGLPIAGTLIAITFFCGFIPILGAYISGLIVFLIALAGGGLDSALIMLAVLIVVHGAESIWIAPMTYRKTVALNPIATLAAVTAGAALMGIVGAIIAVPIVAFFWVVLNELRSEWAAEDGAAAPSG
ncbi:MAG: AI-2E family transporter [Actinomycetes bacterium]